MKLDPELAERIIKMIKKGHSMRSITMLLDIGRAKVKAYAEAYGGDECLKKLIQNGVEAGRRSFDENGFKRYGYRMNGTKL